MPNFLDIYEIVICVIALNKKAASLSWIEGPQFVLKNFAHLQKHGCQYLLNLLFHLLHLKHHLSAQTQLLCPLNMD